MLVIKFTTPQQPIFKSERLFTEPQLIVGTVVCSSLWDRGDLKEKVFVFKKRSEMRRQWERVCVWVSVSTRLSLYIGKGIDH